MTARQTLRQRRIFRLPSFKLRKKGAQAGRMSQVTWQERSSLERVLANTPRLAALYAFLARPLP